MYLIGMHITTEPRDQLLYLQDIVMCMSNLMSRIEDKAAHNDNNDNEVPCNNEATDHAQRTIMVQH